jgi:hypothetical protein
MFNDVVKHISYKYIYTFPLYVIGHTPQVGLV